MKAARTSRLLLLLGGLILAATTPLTGQTTGSPTCVVASAPTTTRGTTVSAHCTLANTLHVGDTLTRKAPAPAPVVDTVRLTIHDTVTVTVHDSVLVAPPAQTTPAAPAASAAPTAPLGTSEPVFDSTRQLLLLRDDFDADAGFATAEARGWRCTNSSTTQDVSTNPRGACQIIAPGSQGSAHAIRLVYDGIANAAGQEGHSWNYHLGDTLAGLPGHTAYLSYDFRITPGSGYVLDSGVAGLTRRIVQVKWLELWDATDRAQFNTQYATCTGQDNVPYKGASGTGTLFHFYGNGGGTTPCNAGQTRPPFAYQGQGQWHRATYRYVSRSASTATDGVAQMWVDGVLVLSVNAADCSTVVPNTLAVSPDNTWCKPADLAAMFVRQHVWTLSFGNVSATYLWPFSIDLDHVRVWRD